MRNPFRINRHSSLTPDGDQYLERLLKLIPTEVVTIYLAGKETAANWIGIWSIVCLIMVVVVRTLGTKQQGKPIQFIAVFVSCVSFIIWIYATGSLKLPPNMAGVPSISILVWTFLVPYIYKGD